MPRVSVLMPCYNAAATLDLALDSLEAQTLGDYEVIAVDDGSSDGTSALLEQRARRDARLRIIRRAHGGIIEALNAGLKACRAAYVARMDSDDICHPQRLELQTAFLDAQPDVGLVACQVRGFPEEAVREGFEIYMNWQNSLFTDEEIRREIFVESPFAHPSVVYRKELVQSIGAYQEHGWAEDYDLWLRMYLAGVRFAKLGRILLEWREHPERLTRADSRYSLENFLRCKAHYLARGPLQGREAVILWGAGMMGRRLSKHLLREGARMVAFVDIDPRKIGRTRRGLPILDADELMDLWVRYDRPAILAAVGARGARDLIRERLNSLDLCEGRDWWGVA